MILPVYRSLVSVILPNYNHAAYLKERIDSILNQTFRDFELIILDDSSTDNSRDVLESYKHHEKVSHLIFNETNSGSPFLQWNKGFELAQGKYIWIAESDDYSDLTMLEKVIPLLEANEDTVLACVGSYLIDQNRNILPIDWDKFQTKQEAKFFEGKSFLKNKMLLKTSIYNSGMAVFRKDVLPHIDTDYLNYKSSGDWLFWNRICMQGRVVQYSEKLNYFRQHLNKVTAKSEYSGLRFTESKYVVKKTADMLQLTSWQWKVVAGDFVKNIQRFTKFADEGVKISVLNDVKQFFNFRKNYILIYRIDKVLNLSGFNISKNK